MRIITLTIALLVLLAPGCTSSTTKRACHGGIISALESRHRNTVNVALWTLGNNGFDVPEIEFKGSYAEAEPKLKKLVDQLAKLPSARLRELDESYRDHATIYSPYYPPSLGSDDGWKESLTSDVTTTHDRSPHAEAIALVMETQADVIRTVDPENWWHDTKTREWTAQRPFAPGGLDSTHLFSVEYKIDGVVVAQWSVDTERRLVERQTASSPGTQAPYVKCVGRFADYEPAYPWFKNWLEEDGAVVHDDGSCPRATFRLSAPAVYAGRMVVVLYNTQARIRRPRPHCPKEGRTSLLSCPRTSSPEST